MKSVRGIQPTIKLGLHLTTVFDCIGIGWQLLRVDKEFAFWCNARKVGVDMPGTDLSHSDRYPGDNGPMFIFDP